MNSPTTPTSTPTSTQTPIPTIPHNVAGSGTQPGSAATSSNLAASGNMATSSNMAESAATGILGGASKPAKTPILALQDVSYAYTKGGKWVVRHLNQEFAAGEITGIVGPSGAGKTTVLSLLSGLTSPTEGKVLYHGQDLAETDRYRYRSRDIGVIFQSFNLLPALTVEENIILSIEASGKKFTTPKRDLVQELLAKVRLPGEYARERILHLSGGEQQRVAIARALSYQPDIVIADEPTGNLDMETQADIMRIFQQLAHQENKSVIVVTHSPEVAKACDKVFTLRRR